MWTGVRCCLGPSASSPSPGGDIPPDNRDSLLFKSLHSVDDFVHSYLTRPPTRAKIKGRAILAMGRSDKVADVIGGSAFEDPVHTFFKRSSLAANPEQTNPVEMMSNFRTTTILGGDVGGIGSDRALTKQMKLVDSSHMGFLDPIHTPEGSPGITLRMPIAAKKVGNEAKIPVYDFHTKKTVYVGPGELHSEHVALPDQFTWEGGIPKAKYATVKMKEPVNHEFIKAPVTKARYAFLSPIQFYDEATNLIPFLSSDQGNRALMASKMLEQAISLKDREAPHVQVTTGPGTLSLEKTTAQPWIRKAPASGTILSIKTSDHNGYPDMIHLRDGQGALHKIPLYNHFPMNDKESFMHNDVHVKPGDKVEKGQLLADSNHTRGGVMALGRNMTVAYLPSGGYNYQDGIVISDTAAKKFTSTHVHRMTLELGDQDEINRRKFELFASATARKIKAGQLDQIGDDGIAKVGAKVKPGDILITAVGKPNFSPDEERQLKRIDKRLLSLRNRSVEWDSAHEGEVVKVVRHPNEKQVTVYVKTQEPIQVGDKLAGRHGNKGICHSADTEVLTGEGWKKFFDVQPQDLICTRNPLSGAIEYQAPLNHTAYAYEGEMYSFEGRRLSLLTTPEHRHYVRKPKGSDYELRSARDCFGHQLVHLRTGTWEGVEMPTVTIPGRVRAEGSKEHHKFCEPRDYDADDFLEFFGYWVTEGSLGSGGHITVAQRKEVNPETYEAICQVLERMGYTPYQGPDMLVISDPRLHAWLSQFGISLEKYIPREFLGVSKRQLRILADALFAGDGGVYYREKDDHTRYELYTSSARLADDYQELALKLGVSANIRPQVRKDRANTEYVVRWSLNGEVYTTKDSRYESRGERWVPYAGMVYCVEVPNHVIYVRRNGIPVWSGNCTQIRQDTDMPYFIKDGEKKHVEILLSPSGVPSRVNPAQMLETAAGKIAEKTGQPYYITNFGSESHVDKVQKDLAKHGLKDTEQLHDPKTGRVLGDILTGSQFIMKLKHTVDHKLAYRGFGSEEGYTQDLHQPTGTGSAHPGQALGQLELYGLMAHGVPNILREISTYKADQQTGPGNNTDGHRDFWQRVMMGQPLPPPNVPFVYQKFEALLKGMGVDVKKDGSKAQLVPFTDADVRKISNGALKDAGRGVRSKNLKELLGGLFDPAMTGGLATAAGKGLKYTHIELPECIPNPTFVGTRQRPGPAVILSGMKFNEFEQVVKGELCLGKKTGGPAIEDLLKQVNPKKEIAELRPKMATLRGQALDQANRKMRFLLALEQTGKAPHEVYMQKLVPVIPPVFRPLTRLPDGSLRPDDINFHYKNIAHLADQLKTFDPGLPQAKKKNLRKELYEAMRAYTGIRDKGADPLFDASRKVKGILDVIRGGEDAQPKTGLFLKNMVKKRQDLSMRSTIVVEPNMHMDEIGLPKEGAVEMYKPFIVRELVARGLDPRQALEEVKKRTTMASQALDRVMTERPVLMKRDPMLHQYGIMAYKPRLVEGSAIKIHPLVTAAHGADFDGNCFVYDTLTLAKFDAKNFPSSTLLELAEALSMKFSDSTRVVARDAHGTILEMKIGEFPRTDAVPQRDRNGALVYGVPAGISVWTYDHAGATGKFSPVTHVTVEDNCDVARVRTRSFEVEGSTNESLCVYDHETLEVRDIRPEEAVGRLSPVLRRIPQGAVETDFETGWLVGAFVSDGSLTHGIVSYSKTSQAHRERFRRALVQAEGRELPTERTYTDQHDGTHGISGESVAARFSQVSVMLPLLHDTLRDRVPGERPSLTKRLPSAVFSLTEAGLLGVLSGLLDGDGSVSVTRRTASRAQVLINFSTSSPGLAQDVSLLCSLLGIRTSCTPTEPSDSRVQTHTSYTVSLSSVDTKRYAQRLILSKVSASEALEQLYELSAMKDDRDIVPVPLLIMDICSSANGPCASDGALRRTVASAKSHRKGAPYVTRSVAQRMLVHLRRDLAPIVASTPEGSEIPPVVYAWGMFAKLAGAEDVSWEVIEEVTPTGKKQVFDLEVPETKVFAVNGGLVVWDTVSVFVPLQHSAVQEAHKMYPSNLLFSSTHYGVMHAPDQDMQHGLFLASRWGKDTGQKYKTVAEAKAAEAAGKLRVDDVIHTPAGKTTLGRLLIHEALPAAMRADKALVAKLSDPHFELVASPEGPSQMAYKDIFTKLAKNHPKDYATVVDRLKDIGNDSVYKLGSTVSLKDLQPNVKLRAATLRPFDAEAAKVRLQAGTKKEKDAKVVEIYGRATKSLEKVMSADMHKNGNRFHEWYRSGGRGKMTEVMQITTAPMLLQNAHGGAVPTPVMRSYAEGLDVGEYWTTQHGARTGALGRAEESSAPGATTKDIINTSMPIRITSSDCQAKEGISLKVSDGHESKDLHGRFLAVDTKAGEKTLKAGTLLDSQVLAHLQKHKVDQVVVRSPLRCQHGSGICAKCMGLSQNGVLHEPGTNIGIIAGQALGEPMLQLAMKSWHIGGTVSGSSKSTSAFGHLKSVLLMPEIAPNQAVLAHTSGKVTKIEKDPTLNQHHVYIDGVKQAAIPSDKLPVHRDKLLELGTVVRKGDPITTGIASPYKMLEITKDIHRVQNHIVDDLYKNVYGPAGVRRRNIEVVIRATTGLTKVNDPGDSPFTAGDVMQRPAVEHYNRNLKPGQKQIAHSPMIRHLPETALDQHEDWLARLNYRRQKSTLLEGVAKGWVTNTHGNHPIPAFVTGADLRGVIGPNTHVKRVL